MTDTDSRYEADLDAIKPVLQTKVFADLPETLLCGKRGKLSFLNATRTEQSLGDSKAFHCPANTEACSSNIARDGATYCVSDTSECPVTDLMVLEAGSPILKDSRYESRRAAVNSNLYLAFTK